MIIKFSAINAEGCKTNIDTILEITSYLTPNKSRQLFKSIQYRIYTFTKINKEWDTDDILSDLEEFLKSEKIAYRWLSEDEIIEFQSNKEE